MNFTLLYPGFKRHAVTFSYDDGIIQDERTCEILHNHHLKGTFNLNSQKSGERKFRNGIDCSYLDLSQAKDIYSDMEIATHTATHPHLETLPYEEQKREFLEDRDNLEQLFSTKIFGGAYPYGTYDASTLKALRELNLTYCRTTRSTYDFRLPIDFLLWHPTIHHRDPRLFETLERFQEDRTELGCFYLWGHSYEFALDDNFSLLERFCTRVAKDADIYNGTNGEIYHYVLAATSCYYRINAFYNPSDEDAYLITEKGDKLMIPKGETLYYE